MATNEIRLYNEQKGSVEDKVKISRQAWKNFGMSLASITPSRLAQILLWIGALAGLIWLALASWPALVPFIAGGLLAYVVLPMVNTLDRFLPRLLAALVSVLFVLACIGGVLWVVVPPLVKQTVELIQQIPPDTTLQSLGNGLIAQVQTLPPAARDLVTKAILSATTDLSNRLQTITPTLFSFNAVVQLLNAIGFILGLIVLPTWLLTVLKGSPNARLGVNNFLPTNVQADFWALVRIVDRSFGVFLRGQVLVSFVVGVLTYFGLRLLTLLGAPQGGYPVTFGVIAGIMQLIPDVGPIVNTVFVAVLAYRIDPTLAIYVVGLYLAIQYAVSHLVKARIEERIINVNPALLVLFIVALGQLGFVWLFLAAPLAGSTRDLFRYVYGRLAEPPRMAGLLPDEKMPPPVVAGSSVMPKKQPPMIYRRISSRQNQS